MIIVSLSFFLAVIEIKSSDPKLAADANGTIYSCIATGYPFLQLLMWMSGNGQIIPHVHYSTSLEEHNFNMTLTSQLVVNEESCREARGYVCVFNNGALSAIRRSLSIECIPGS